MKKDQLNFESVHGPFQLLLGTLQAFAIDDA